MKHEWEEISIDDATKYAVDAMRAASNIGNHSLGIQIALALLEDNAFYICSRCGAIEDKSGCIAVQSCDDVIANKVIDS